MSKKIKVVMCPVNRAPYVTNISDSLENLQKIVGGYIETVGIATDCVMVCNEEGRLIGLPDNRSVSWLMPYSVQGDVFFCGVEGEEFADVPEAGREMILRVCKKMWLQEDAQNG